MSKVKDENLKTGQQSTDQPWKYPKPEYQEPGGKPPQKKDRERDYKDNETA
jgi:hypothetical protein